MSAIILCVDVLDDGPDLDRALRESGHVPMHASLRFDLADLLSRGSIDVVIAREGPAFAQVVDTVGRFAPPDAPPPLLALRAHGHHSGEQGPAGAFATLTTPAGTEAVRLAITAALERRARQREEADHRGAQDGSCRDPLVVGQGPAYRRLIQRIAAAAGHDQPVLIVGEPGVGKTLAARAVHAQGARRCQPFVAVSCGAYSGPALDDMLFGAEEDAWRPRRGGALHRAENGSLLLRDAPDLDPCLQSRLVQELTAEKGGDPATRPRPRVFATCGWSPDEARVRWREMPLGRDIDFEMIPVPPLRERMEDLPLLVGHFVGQTSERMGLRPPEVLREGLARLERRTWQGNLRELENAVERAVILRRSRPLDDEAFGESVRGPGDTERIRRTRTFNLTHLERVAIRAALEASGGHQTRAARLLGISPRTLRRRLRERPWSSEAMGAGRRRPATHEPLTAAEDSSSAPSHAGIGSGQRGVRAISSEGNAGTRERARPDTALALETAEHAGGRPTPDDAR